jgi:hypothetical protein
MLTARWRQAHTRLLPPDPTCLRLALLLRGSSSATRPPVRLLSRCVVCAAGLHTADGHATGLEQCRISRSPARAGWVDVSCSLSSINWTGVARISRGYTHVSFRQDVRTFCTSSSGDPLRQLTCTVGMWEVVGDGRRRGSLLHDCYPVDCEPSLIRTMDIACISTGAGVEGVNQVVVQIKRNL